MRRPICVLVAVSGVVAVTWLSWLFGTQNRPDAAPGARETPSARPIPDATRGNLERTASEFDEHRLMRLFERPPSFSLVFFDGDLTAQLPDLLEKCGYRILGTAQATGPLLALNAEMSDPQGPNNSIVFKGFFKAGNFTVLIEPEMVLFAASDQLSGFCEQYSTRAVAAIWERASESAGLVEYDNRGVTRQTWFSQGVPTGEQIDPHLHIVERPNSEGLKAALQELGIPVQQVFGQVDVAVLQLQE